MSDFKSFGLPAPLDLAIERMNFTTPTPIQLASIPVAMQGRDILGSAQTGTGKTGAFGIPMIARLLNSSRGTALVMTPTRELATQVMETLKLFLKTSPQIKTALLIGGESMPKQFAELKQRPRVIVGTPGRINDHLERGSLMLHDTNFLVLDETDRMLDLGFGVQIERIVKFLPANRQTLLFSATMPANIAKLADKYLKNPERIAMGSTISAPTNIKQEIIHTSEAEKYNVLLAQLNERKGSIIVFVKTKWGAEKMSQKLVKQGYSADAIHGDLQQRQRDRAIQAFRDKKHRIMVATDIASRGLDIPHIEHVINYDLPQCPEDFIHRIGRTARAGAEGSALSLLAPADDKKWRAIEKLIDPTKVQSEPRRAAPSGRRSGGYRGSNGSGKPGGQGAGQATGGEGGANRPFRPRRRRTGESRNAA